MPSAVFNGARRVPPAVNEPIKDYAPGSTEKQSLKARLASMAGENPEIPVVIAGKRIHTGEVAQVTNPCNHQEVLATWHKARPEDVNAAITAANDAQREWASWRWEDRAAVFLRAADLLATSWRDTLNAATMLGQSKTIFQSEIDAACELIDFWRFNAAFAQEIYDEQPITNSTMWNQTDYRPLEGFVYAISPFNFTAIGGNLTSAPALMGNTIVWKPSATAMLAAWHTLQLLEAAGLPPGVINFLPGDPEMISDRLLADPTLAGVHFTGSSKVFNGIWKTVGSNMGSYRGYPRIVGETGGKDFIVAHSSADPAATAVAMVRGAFEFQGQKCSAASRAYIPKSLWPEIRDRAVAMMGEMKMGDVRDFRNFTGAVIDERSLNKIEGYLQLGRESAKIIAGGKTDKSKGWFVQNTLIESEDPSHRLLCEEIFGPVLTCHVYDDSKWDETLKLVDNTSAYALTGAVLGNDKKAIHQASNALRQAAGNFYINDKPTGAVVGQQPFGGARASGTNDKAGSKLNLVRWVSARTIKETFNPPTDWKYPFLGEE